MKTKSIGGAMLLFALLLPFTGQTQPFPPDPHPLRPADNSSPRDTLRSFLTNTNKGIQTWLSGGSRELLTPHRIRALESLDFSQLPDRHLASTQVKHVLLLKEILDRITPPPDDQIPGAREVTDQGITRWIVPNTRIAIAQTQEGPRKGEFLFTAHTVKQLGEMYRLVKHLPYQPNATEGIYEKYLKSIGSAETDAVQVRNHLKPVDTSSPLSTFVGFWESLDRAYRLIMDADFALKTDPPAMSRQEGLEVERQADILIQRAMRTLDLSQIPQAIRSDVGIEVALQLKDVLDRISRPPLDSIPDDKAVRGWKLDNKDWLSITPRPYSWKFPNTEIEIVEAVEGPRVGEFLISAETVSRVEAFYQKARDLPYRPGATENFYTFFVSTPGYLVPEAYPLARWIDELPPGFMTLYADQTVWQWLGLLLSIFAIIAGAGLVSFAIRRLSRKVQPLLQEWLSLLVPIVGTFFLFFVHEFINHGLNITGRVLSTMTNILEGAAYALAAWAVYVLFKALAETVIITPRIPDESIDASLLRLGARLVGFLMGAWVLIEGAQELGMQIVPLLAGLGVGGLALALAARPTIENIIGSFMIFADKPYRLGQRIKVMGVVGDVESIGLRSTKIRLLNGHQTSIPNEKMSSMEIENIGRRPYIRRIFNITVTYDTSPEKINRAVEILKEILAVPEVTACKKTESTESEAEQPAHPNEAINRPDFPPRVHFNEFNADSLNIYVSYWFHPADYWEFMAYNHRINIQIMERFTAEGIDFAFPTQTLHLAGHNKRPLTVDQQWVSEDENA